MAQLLVNHAPLAGKPDRMNAVLHEAADLFEHVEESGSDAVLARLALSMRAYCDLALGQPAEAINLLDRIDKPMLSSEVVNSIPPNFACSNRLGNVLVYRYLSGIIWYIVKTARDGGGDFEMIFDSKPLDFDFLREQLMALPLALAPFRLQISAVVLFGSLSTGRETPLSDVDLAVLYRRDLRNPQLEGVHSQVYEIISDLLMSDDIDVINLNLAPLSIQYGAIKQATILILNRRGEYIDFWEQTVKNYLDFKPLVDECNRTLLDTLAGRAAHG